MFSGPGGSAPVQRRVLSRGMQGPRLRLLGAAAAHARGDDDGPPPMGTCGWCGWMEIGPKYCRQCVGPMYLENGTAAPGATGRPMATPFVQTQGSGAAGSASQGQEDLRRRQTDDSWWRDQRTLQLQGHGLSDGMDVDE